MKAMALPSGKNAEYLMIGGGLLLAFIIYEKMKSTSAASIGAGVGSAAVDAVTGVLSGVNNGVNAAMGSTAVGQSVNNAWDWLMGNTPAPSQSSYDMGGTNFGVSTAGGWDSVTGYGANAQAVSAVPLLSGVSAGTDPVTSQPLLANFGVTGFGW